MGKQQGDCAERWNTAGLGVCAGGYHTEDMRALLALLAALAILLLVFAIIVETLEFLFSVGFALLALAAVVLVLRRVTAKR